MPAVNHSAHFLFPSAEPAHQGNYSCVYHLFVFLMTSPLRAVCSPSPSQIGCFSPTSLHSSSMYGVSGAQLQGFQVFRGSTFSISCSIQPQLPGGSFQLNFTSINSTHNYYSLPAVNHSAHFLFLLQSPPTRETTASRLLSVTVTGELLQFIRQMAPCCSDFRVQVSTECLLTLDVMLSMYPEPFIIRAVVLPLIQLLATRGRRPSRQEDIELDYDTWIFLQKRKELREQ
ncbi:hypothetical protein F7725_014928, partial [Dissostichus mawsoni]